MLQVSRSAHYRQHHLGSYSFCGDVCPNHMHQCMVRRVQCFRPQDPEMHCAIFHSLSLDLFIVFSVYCLI